MSETVRVNFSRPIPLFPLAGTVLLPHAVQPLRIFEPRYLQMVDDCLDQSGQFAMATFAGEAWKENYHGTPELRPAVCVGQIVQHQKLADGQHYLVLHGVCRATIRSIQEPDGVRQYRMGELLPLETGGHPPAMDEVREGLRRVLDSRRLQRMRGLEAVLEWFDRDDVPTHALLELVGFTLVHDAEMRYRLLAEADPFRRATLLRNELSAMDRLLARAECQRPECWPKGMSWN